MDNDSEKSAVAQHIPDLEPQQTGKSFDDVAALDISPEEGRAIIRRVDVRLVVTVGVLYCMSLMDRTNLSAAAIAGMTKELALIGNRYVSRHTLACQWVGLQRYWSRLV